MKYIYKMLVTFFASLSMLLSEMLIVEQIGDEYHKPVYLTAAKNQSDTLYIVEQRGRIQTIIQGQTVDPLLDIHERVHQPRMPEMNVVFWEWRCTLTSGIMENFM